MIKCSKCGGATKEKTITTKFGPTTIGECQSGCVNEKGYALWTFAPREKKPSVPPGLAAPREPNKQDEILRCLLRIEKILANPTKLHVASNELQPDEQLPEGF